MLSIREIILADKKKWQVDPALTSVQNQIKLKEHQDRMNTFIGKEILLYATVDDVTENFISFRKQMSKGTLSVQDNEISLHNMEIRVHISAIDFSSEYLNSIKRHTTFEIKGTLVELLPPCACINPMVLVLKNIVMQPVADSSLLIDDFKALSNFQDAETMQELIRVKKLKEERIDDLIQGSPYFIGGPLVILLGIWKKGVWFDFLTTITIGAGCILLFIGIVGLLQLAKRNRNDP